jgi:hypothetical protein
MFKYQKANLAVFKYQKANLAVFKGNSYFCSYGSSPGLTLKTIFIGEKTEY